MLDAGAAACGQWMFAAGRSNFPGWPTFLCLTGSPAMLAIREWRHWLVALLVGGCVLGTWTAVTTAKDEPAATEESTDKPKRNPFVPRASLSEEELFEYIDRMMEAPRSVQSQEEYGPAMVICAERLLAKNAGETMRAYATNVKLQALHKVAQYDNQEYQEKLVKFAKECETDKDKGVVKAAKFYLLENEIVTFQEKKPETYGKLLDETYEMLKPLDGEALDARYLRVASYLTRVMNDLPEEDRVAKEYKRFGELFSKSEYRELSKYGKRIAKGVPGKDKVEELAGKPMPIDGMTHDDKKFDIKQYKGKVVLVDFWATWCGPCRAAMPALIDLYDEMHDQGFEVVAVSLDQDKDALIKYIDENEIEWPNIFDADDSDADRKPLAERYSVNAIPMTFLLDKEGKVVAKNLHGEKLKTKIEALLSGKETAPKPKEAEPKAAEKKETEKQEAESKEAK
jgi:thiol-disulfide isomerase/thioredoxin